MKLYSKLFKTIDNFEIKKNLFLKYKLFTPKPRYNINKDFNIMDYVKKRKDISIPINERYETIDFNPKKK